MTFTSRSHAADSDRWDTVLEGSVIGSFTSLGFKVRSRKWDELDLSAVAGKTVVITGATSGIGRKVATDLALGGARLRFIARNSRKAEDLKQELLDLTDQSDIDYYLADLSEIANVSRSRQTSWNLNPPSTCSSTTP